MFLTKKKPVDKDSVFSKQLNSETQKLNDTLAAGKSVNLLNSATISQFSLSDRINEPID